jgi:hypothetical protein
MTINFIRTRTALCALLASVGVLTGTSFGHGPQLQVTIDAGKITTREVILDGPYSESLTAPKSAYVIPIRSLNDIAYVRPNDALDSITGLPVYVSGPGLAYGYHVNDSSFPPFAAGSVFGIEFTSGLLRWDGTAFQDAGATELKAYRGSDPAITDPADRFAITSDSGPYDSLSLSALTADYNAEAHGTVRYALLGDGSTVTSASQDGVYLASLRLTSSQSDLAASDPYYFVLHKNESLETVAAAVQSLGIDASRIQYVPEPSSWILMILAGLTSASCFRSRTRS